MCRPELGVLLEGAYRQGVDIGPMMARDPNLLSSVFQLVVHGTRWFIITKDELSEPL